jgi:type I restriction enzyme M protein
MKKEFLEQLLFNPKNNTANIYHKKYTHLDNYIIEIDLEKKIIDFGRYIFFNDSKNSIQQIVKPEDSVVLECIDRLLTKGYSPKNITLEKRYPSGHGHSGRLDILVTNEDNKAYMMIECKTWGKEFDKEFTKLHKDGGQLFTYFQNDKDTQFLVLYTSSLIDNKIEYRNEIIKIEKEYRATSNVKDFFDRWNKVSKNNGIFNDWNTPYNYESKALTPKDLVDIKQIDSGFIFNRFMEILRHNVVSDKPNAFNKIFTLFLCKIMDEKKTRENEELDFQWLEGIDTDISFQKRLTDLYQKGMKEFLDKEVTDLSDKEFEERFGVLEQSMKDKLLEEFTKIRLQKNNEFAIKDVFDAETFEENAIVVKEIVELLQGYRIRYTKKQQFLSDFFELLLTTGLKQEVGQFFTPVPIAKFIIKSIPFDKIIKEKLEIGEKDELLPNVIDYAVGSGHFITEAMDEIQRELNNISASDYISDTAKKIKSWQEDHFDWAYDYVYGIEKDYRLVKTAKVGCYLHGDGLAKVIHGDGLSNFTTTKEFKGKLKYSDKNYPQDNKKFDVVVSNPPYSVSAFKNVSKKFDNNDFELYNRLTDQSSEIEALFIERTKQLLRDGGIAGIVLPSSILTGGGIYIKTREIILKYFDIVSITELGSNTFMATGTNTVVLFLRRKNNMIHVNISSSIDKLFDSQKDITINGIENPLSKYIAYVWENISFDDYLTLLEKNPNEKIVVHEIFREYSKKYSDEKIVEREKEKFFYFLLAFNQKVTLVKTGEKQEEKKFLGYEFSNRRGSEGIHPIQRDKSIDECTSLYDSDSYENFSKINSYIYSAFDGKEEKIDEKLKQNLSYIDLIDMMDFRRIDFDKFISTNAKKKVKIESKWDIVKIEEVSTEIINGSTPPKKEGEYWNSNDIPWLTIPDIDDSSITLNNINQFTSKKALDDNKVRPVPINSVLLSCTATLGKVAISRNKIITNQQINAIVCNENIVPEYLAYYLKTQRYNLENLTSNVGVKHINIEMLKNFKIPLPPKEIQEKIVKEIEELEQIERKNKEIIENNKYKIKDLLTDLEENDKSLISSISQNWDNKRKPVTAGDRVSGEYPYYGASGIVDYVDQFLIDDTVLLISEDGANLKSRVSPIAFTASGKIWVNNHAHILKFDNKYTHKIVELYLNNIDLSEYITGQAQPKLNQKNLNNIKIPLPSLDEQEKLVKEIETIELQINKKEEEIKNIPRQKEEILNQYLK